jgi:hypothetical protein
MRMKTVFFCALILLFGLVSSAYARNEQFVGDGCPDLAVPGITSKHLLFSTIKGLQEAAASKDEKKISRYLLYPVSINAHSGRKSLRSEKDLEASFAKIFTPKVLSTISQQKPENVFCNYQGVMLGDGEVWIGQRGRRIGVFTLNL